MNLKLSSLALWYDQTLLAFGPPGAAADSATRLPLRVDTFVGSAAASAVFSGVLDVDSFVFSTSIAEVASLVAESAATSLESAGTSCAKGKSLSQS